MKNIYKLRTDEISKLIQTQGLKKYWVAEISGVHKTTLNRWLSGEIRWVSEHHAQNLARTLTIDLSSIAEQTA